MFTSVYARKVCAVVVMVNVRCFAVSFGGVGNIKYTRMFIYISKFEKPNYVLLIYLGKLEPIAVVLRLT